jgi:chromosome segregation ATPase
MGRILIVDLLPYSPVAGGVLLFVYVTWGLFKKGRKAQSDDEQNRIEKATRESREALSVAQQSNTILENQNGILKEKMAEKDAELVACEKKCSEVTRFNFRLQGDIDELERRVSELEGIHNTKNPRGRGR